MRIVRSALAAATGAVILAASLGMGVIVGTHIYVGSGPAPKDPVTESATPAPHVTQATRRTGDITTGVRRLRWAQWALIDMDRTDDATLDMIAICNPHHESGSAAWSRCMDHYQAHPSHVTLTGRAYSVLATCDTGDTVCASNILAAYESATLVTRTEYDGE